MGTSGGVFRPRSATMTSGVVDVDMPIEYCFGLVNFDCFVSVFTYVYPIYRFC